MEKIPNTLPYYVCMHVCIDIVSKSIRFFIVVRSKSLSFLGGDIISQRPSFNWNAPGICSGEKKTIQEALDHHCYELKNKPQGFP